MIEIFRVSRFCFGCLYIGIFFWDIGTSVRVEVDVCI